MKRILAFIFRPINKLFWNPSFRYSDFFSKLKNLMNYTLEEEIFETVMKFSAASKMEGDYLEFGVWQGKTFIPAYHFAQKNNLKSMNFYAFDSFQGLPEPKTTEDALLFSKGMYFSSVNEFKNNVSRKKVDLNKVRIVQGWYDKVLNEETKKKLPLKKASVIYIDCDLYESTIPVLNFITDYIQDGTVIIFDDWFCFRGNPDKGEQRAFRGWLKENPQLEATEFHKFGWRANSFIMHKKGGSKNES